MSKSLSITVLSSEEQKKKTLRLLIQKRKNQLTAKITKTEMFKVELDMVRQEYTVRVGLLLNKSNRQDMDIIYFRNVLQLIEKKMTYQEAVDSLDDTYYAEQRRLEEEKEQMRRAEAIYEKRKSKSDNPFNEEIKNLWKSLVSKFHPDLVQDENEKSRREAIMKQLNQAYEEQDIDALKKLENESHIESTEDTTIEKLEEILIGIENDLIAQDVLYKELKESEWYRWKINIDRAKKKGQDIFADIERNLLNEVVRKMEIIKELKKKLGIPVE